MGLFEFSEDVADTLSELHEIYDISGQIGLIVGSFCQFYCSKTLQSCKTIQPRCLSYNCRRKNSFLLTSLQTLAHLCSSRDPSLSFCYSSISTSLPFWKKVFEKDLKKRFPMIKFPESFQDQLLIIRILGYSRLLWILKMIQDPEVFEDT